MDSIIKNQKQPSGKTAQEIVMSKIRMTWAEVAARSLQNLMAVAESGSPEQIARANTAYASIMRSIQLGDECPYVKYIEEA